jgi:glycosyltransferase involved in cell wall biosynthesis
VKVIQLPFCFYPEPVGGTEIYVEAMSRELQNLGVEVLIAVPGKQNQVYQYKQLPVHRFALSDKVSDIKELYGAGDEAAAVEFSRILEREKPDLVHLHAFTRGVSLRLVQAAKQQQIPVIFTYHTPTVSCLRGTLMQWGREICDGKLDLYTCSKCTLQGLGLPETSAKIIGNLPPQAGKAMSSLNLQGGFWTALRMTELAQYRHKTFHTLMATVDHIVAVCDWVKDVLLLNQVPSDKISTIRQGLCQESPESSSSSISSSITSSQQSQTSNLKIAFFGRLDPIKGIHILIEALQITPQLPISLDIYGVSQGADGDAYQKQLHFKAVNDPRITFKPPVPAEQVTTILKDYDLLAVPSQWLETGPMVILEAFAAKVPVLGSNLGGIAELVMPGVNGILVEASDIKAWSQTLQQLCLDREMLISLRAAIQPPLRMDTVASRMLSIYKAHI